MHVLKIVGIVALIVAAYLFGGIWFARLFLHGGRKNR